MASVSDSALKVNVRDTDTMTIKLKLSQREMTTEELSFVDRYLANITVAV